MKKSGSIIEAAAGAVIFVIGLVLCFHNYVQKGNTAYAVSLLVAIAGVIVLIAGKKGFVAISIDKDMMNSEIGFLASFISLIPLFIYSTILLEQILHR